MRQKASPLRDAMQRTRGRYRFPKRRDTSLLVNYRAVGQRWLEDPVRVAVNECQRLDSAPSRRYRRRSRSVFGPTPRILG